MKLQYKSFQDLLNMWPDHTNVVKQLIIHHSKYNQNEIVEKINHKIDFLFSDFKKDMTQYINGKPLQYIMGYTFFLDAKILVNKKVFIPRPETEMLVNETITIINDFFTKKDLKIVDICSGSGAAAISFSQALKAKVWGLEVSDNALDIANLNNNKNKTNVIFVKSNIDEYLLKNSILVDVIFCNPPYIKIGENLASKVKDFEPNLALFDYEGDGLSFHRHILKNLDIITNKKAIIVFEMGHKHDQILEKYLKKNHPFLQFRFIKDYNNINRGILLMKGFKKVEWKK